MEFQISLGDEKCVEGFGTILGTAGTPCIDLSKQKMPSKGVPRQMPGAQRPCRKTRSAICARTANRSDKGVGAPAQRRRRAVAHYADQNGCQV